MPVRHFYLFSHYICYGLFFLFSVCWLHVNEFNSLWEQLRGRRQKATATHKVFLPAIFTCSHITFVIVYSFYFLCFGSRRNECNSFWERGGGEFRRILLTRKAYLSCNFIYLLSYFFSYSLPFLFSVFWLQKE